MSVPMFPRIRRVPWEPSHLLQSTPVRPTLKRLSLGSPVLEEQMSHSLVPSSPLGRFPGKFFGSTVNGKDFRDWFVNANYTTPSPERPATDSKADSNEEALLDSAETKGTPQMLRDLSKSLTKQYKALKPSQSLTSSSSSKSRIDIQDSIPSKEGTNHKGCSPSTKCCKKELFSAGSSSPE